MGALTILTDKTKYVNWIISEFQPRTLAIPISTIEQMVDNAVRYWNTHSAYKISQMVTYGGNNRIQVSNQFKDVAIVYPNRTANWIWNEFPTWSLAGVAVLDNVRTDLILATEAFKTFNIYVGADFRHWYDANHDDPTEGGYLNVRNVPSGTDSFFVVGTKRILPADDIDSQHINDWLLYYSKALVKMAEGHAIRATKIVLPGVDGQEMYNEGKNEKEELQKKLAQDGRWVAFIRRQ
jgi:hypothetical protein